MSFDIETTIKDMINAMSGIVDDKWEGVKDCVDNAFAEEKAALSDIANAWIDGEIDDEELDSQLEDEKVALEAALLVCRVRAKVMAQNAANAAIDVLRDAIKAAI